MSRPHIQAYRRRLDKLMAATSSRNEGPLSAAFADLLDRWGASQDLTLVPQWEGKGRQGNDIRVDGALVPFVLRIPFGYWEAKDSKDDLDREIAAKLRSGYPDDNIVYEDTVTAVLRQDGREVDRVQLQGDDDALLRLLTRFFAYERPEIAEFRAAARKFRENLPSVLQALREAVTEAEAGNPAFAEAAADFLAHAKEAINPAVTPADVREMLIQHILTEDIFRRVFDNQDYHRQNNVAQRLIALEDKFFTGDLRARTVEQLRPYYNAIQRAALDIADRREKQRFLKNLYEDFYKVYNPKAADRLGVVYTPGEIVRFMIRGAETLCQRHFGRALIDPGVEILDPATGTGTFIVELLEHFRDDRTRLAAKYAQELHANEVAILPYYVANLNIEATYAAITGSYAEFPGLVFVDTLDNTAALGRHSGFQGDMFGGFADENLARVKRQNDKPLTLIIGNPPYNANQQSENDDNKNRNYPHIDSRVKETYIQTSRSRKTKTYDPYKRFFRWASDRLRDKGIIAYITNRSFIDSKEGDGFRKTVSEEFDRVIIVDLGGDWKDKGRGGGSNVFGIGTGVAITFLVRDKTHSQAHSIEYLSCPENDACSKLSWLGSSDLVSLDLQRIKIDANSAWFEQADFSDDLMPLVNEITRQTRRQMDGSAVFRDFGLGISTNRDGWLIGNTTENVFEKAKVLAERYHSQETGKPFRKDVKWSRNLKRRFTQGRREALDSKQICDVLYRPYTKRLMYVSPLFVDELGHHRSQFQNGPQPTIYFSNGRRSDFAVWAGSKPAGLDMFLPNSTTTVTRYRDTPDGTRVDNITDWALRRIAGHYADEFAGSAPLTKDDIFAYGYAALHDPVWRTTHADDLRREFPRIPLHPGFARWRDWGQTLLDLHLGYETAKPWPLTRVDTPGRKAATPKLKSLPDIGTVQVDSETQLTGIPAAAWDYRLGNRSAIDWVLDQHKEKTPRDPTVARLFNTYRFADHREAMIDLLARVVRVSVETVAITDAMRAHGVASTAD